MFENIHTNIIIHTIYSGSPNSILCPLVGSGILYMDHSKKQVDLFGRLDFHGIDCQIQQSIIGKMVVPFGWYPSCLSPLRTPFKGDILDKYPLYKLYMGLIIKGTIPMVPPFSL